MNWGALSIREWRRRPLRSGVMAAGVAIAVAAMFSLLAFHDGYRDGVRHEIDRLGAHILVVPKGCPYDAASIALHGANWPCYLKSNYLAEVSGTAGVASAAPAFMAALAFALGPQVETMAKNWVPFAPAESLLMISAAALLRCGLLALLVGGLAAIYPAWRAARLQPALATRAE